MCGFKQAPSTRHSIYYCNFNFQELLLKNFLSLVLFINTRLSPFVNSLKICVIQKLDVTLSKLEKNSVDVGHF